MTLLRYFVDDGNFTLTIKDFEDDDGPMLSLITWPRYDFDRLSSSFPMNRFEAAWKFLSCMLLRHKSVSVDGFIVRFS